LAEKSALPAVNPFSRFHGLNLVAVVITSSDCGWSSQPSVIKRISKIGSMLRSIHGDRFASVITIGASLDTDLKVGFDFLAKLSGQTSTPAFDQIIVGGSWLNEQV